MNLTLEQKAKAFDALCNLSKLSANGYVSWIVTSKEDEPDEVSYQIKSVGNMRLVQAEINFKEKING